LLLLIDNYDENGALVGAKNVISFLNEHFDSHIAKEEYIDKIIPMINNGWNNEIITKRISTGWMSLIPNGYDYWASDGVNLSILRSAIIKVLNWK
jgi:hypothetical protein